MDTNQLTQDPEIQNLIMQEQIEKNVRKTFRQSFFFMYSFKIFLI
jgi:hypothetical protein